MPYERDLAQLALDTTAEITCFLKASSARVGLFSNNQGGSDKKTATFDASGET